MILDITLQSRGAKRRGMSGDAIRSRYRSGDVPWRHRVYPQSIFRPRKLRLAELIVGLQGFYFIPGPPNPTVALAKRYFGDHFRVHLVRNTNKQTNKNTRSISDTHERKERFAQKITMQTVYYWSNKLYILF